MARPRLFDSNDRPGKIKEHSGTTLPANHLLCDGQVVLVADYPELYAEIGTAYNANAGTGTPVAGTSFRVPNKIGRSGIGAGTYTDSVSGNVTRTLGQAVGAEKHKVITDEMPKHTHDWIGPSQTYPGIAGTDTRTLSTSGAEALVNQAKNSSTGGGVGGVDGFGVAHNNMQPSIVVNYVIRY